MEQTFFQLKDFPKIKTHCPFCQHPLQFILSNYIGNFYNLPFIELTPSNDIFFISSDHSHEGKTFYSNFNLDSSINLSTNTVNIEVKQKFKYNNQTNYFGFDYYSEAATNFQKLGLLASLKCINSNCFYNYIISSNEIQLNTQDKVEGIYRYPLIFDILPNDLYMSSFSISNYWVQNLYESNKTIIYSTEQDLQPNFINVDNYNFVEIALIDWEQVPLDRMINKIKTLFIFC